MDTIMDTGWDSDSDSEELEARKKSTKGGNIKDDKNIVVKEEEEEDISDPTGLLPRNCELRAKKNAEAANNGAENKSGENMSYDGKMSALLMRRSVLGIGIAEKNVARGEIDKAFYAWIREQASVDELEELFDGIPEGKRVRAQGRVDGTFMIGLRVIHFKKISGSINVGMHVGTKDVDIAEALKKVCSVEKTRLRGFSSAMSLL